MGGTAKGNMTTKKLLLLVAIVVLCFAALAGWRIWKSAEDGAVLSCLSSAGAAINSLPASEIGINVEGGDWKVLNGAESDQLIRAAMEKQGISDCSHREADGLPVDPWGNHFHIALRRRTDVKTDESPFEFRLWSAGRDEVVGTTDDLVIPYGETIPNR